MRGPPGASWRSLSSLIVNSQGWLNTEVVEDEAYSSRLDTKRHKQTERYKVPSLNRTLELRNYPGSFQ